MNLMLLSSLSTPRRPSFARSSVPRMMASGHWKTEMDAFTGFVPSGKEKLGVLRPPGRVPLPPPEMPMLPVIAARTGSPRTGCSP